MAPKAKNEVRTLAFINPTIVKNDGTRIKFPRGLQITDSDKYPCDKHYQMLVDLAEKNGGQVKLNMEVSVNLNVPNTEPLSADGIDLIE